MKASTAKLLVQSPGRFIGETWILFTESYPKLVTLNQFFHFEFFFFKNVKKIKYFIWIPNNE